MNHSAYTCEELIDVFDKMYFEDMSKSCKETFIKAFLQSLLTAEDSTTETIKSLKETLDLLSKECNNGKPFPVVVDVNGKLLTGEVYYNEYFDFYTETEEEMREKIMEEKLIPTTLSMYIYVFDALLEDENNLDWVLEKIDAVWGDMVLKGADTFFEVQSGASAFDNAGSLCHGWSAVPVYIYGKYLAESPF